MKKYISILASAAVLAILSVSCSILDGNTSTKLKSYTQEMVEDYIVEPVMTINAAAFKGKKDIFKDGYKVRVKDEYIITLLSASDSTWSFVQDSGNSKYVISGIIKMLPDNSLGLHTWSCQADIAYDEGNGYTSILKTENPAEFYWMDELKATQYIYEIVFDGKFTIDTYLSSKHLDNGVITFSKTPTGTVISSDWKLTTYREESK